MLSKVLLTVNTQIKDFFIIRGENLRFECFLSVILELASIKVN